uniref:Uncharacterized protein n=2 Tax=Fagus sylvatica TaxID=28930 RepID=A0A2N9GN14_FAGSY
MTNFEINFLLRQGVNHIEGFDPVTPRMALSKERSKPIHCNNGSMQAHPLQNPIPANPPTTNPQSLQLMTEARKLGFCKNGVTSMGLGMRKRTMRPIEIEIIKGMSLGPDGGGGGGGGDVICEDVEGWFCKFDEVWIGGRRGLKREGFWVGIGGKKREEEDLW